MLNAIFLNEEDNIHYVYITAEVTLPGSCVAYTVGDYRTYWGMVNIYIHVIV